MKRFIVLLLAVLLFVFSAGCGEVINEKNASAESPTDSAAASYVEQSAPESEAAVSGSESEAEEPKPDGRELFTLEPVGEVIDIHTEEQAAFLNGPYDEIGKYTDGKHEYSKPKGAVISWSFHREKLPETYGQPDAFRVLCDTDPGFSDPLVVSRFSGSPERYSAAVRNLFLDAFYYCKVQAIYGDEVFESETFSFRTAATAPRNLDIEGVSNVRDIGGWMIDETHRIKQGIIYRGAAFEDLNYKTHITPRGITQAREELGVRSEIELRWISVGEIESQSGSLLGDDINYYEFEFNYIDEVLLTGNHKSIAKCFELFADSDKYPIYYHCRIGTDRTGVLTYLLLGFLGVDKDRILTDYLFSNFGYVGGNRSVETIQKAYIDLIDSYRGADLQEKITNYLKEKCGVKTATLEKIRRNLIEEI